MLTATKEAYLRERGLIVHAEADLAPFTTLKVGGPAELLVEPRDVDELVAAVESGIPFRVLGSGANLLIGEEGVRGMVIRLHRFRGRRGMYVRAGESLPRLVKETVAEGWGGLEALAGVPASVGGAVYMNAGGRHGEIGGLVRAVDVLDGEILCRLPREEVGFRYRGTALGSRIVLGVEFDLRPDPEAKKKYAEVLADKKATQPLGSPNAGCMFKNPPGDHAGRLIETAGLKGTRVGRVHVSGKHANFTINEGGASADDVFRLIERVRDRVREVHGVELALEIQVWRGEL